jgi:hypothetical protein
VDPDHDREVGAFHRGIDVQIEAIFAWHEARHGKASESFLRANAWLFGGLEHVRPRRGIDRGSPPEIADWRGRVGNTAVGEDAIVLDARHLPRVGVYDGSTSTIVAA